jgi:hypothetical protein
MRGRWRINAGESVGDESRRHEVASQPRAVSGVSRPDRAGRIRPLLYALRAGGRGVTAAADLAVPVHPSQRIPSHWQERRPAIPVVVDGVAFDVVWNGA